MTSESNLWRMGWASRWPRELVFAAFTLIVGFVAMPILIYYAGSTILGPYEGASLPVIYGNVYHGLAARSTASWIVVLGPYGFYLLLKILRLWWRGGTRAA